MSNNDSEQLFFDVQQKTDKQHILDNPDTYIGSVEQIDSDMWIMSDDDNKIIEKNICYIPGLFKLFKSISATFSSFKRNSRKYVTYLA